MTLALAVYQELVTKKTVTRTLGSIIPPLSLVIKRAIIMKEKLCLKDDTWRTDERIELSGATWFQTTNRFREFSSLSNSHNHLQFPICCQTWSFCFNAHLTGSWTLNYEIKKISSLDAQVGNQLDFLLLKG